MDITKKDYEFASKAYEYASLSPMMMQHGCVLVHNSRVISGGYNHYYAPSMERKSYCSCHAEMDALRRLRRRRCSSSRMYKHKRFKEV